jgi:ATP-dependent RNA helicase SUPV3L1/SUV3
LLGPLLAIAGAEDVTGIARGIAFQLVEALGVLERSKVAEDLKSLDQASRATLRKYGLRFGAFHLYIPALLKPAPRSLAAQLWTLQNDADDKGLVELQQLAGSGRTSMPVDKEVSTSLYRTVGYRVCGERAIRVDMLERLADLIRPALAWRDNSPGVKPPGALDGTGFTVTGAMTSLVGASGEDFASVLRSLGYRMERRPKPPEPIVETKPEVTEANAETEAEPSNDAVTSEAAETDRLTGQQTASEAVENENETVSSLPSDESDAPAEEASESEVLVEPEDATEAQARAADHDYDPVEPQTDISELTAPASAHSEQIDIGVDAGSRDEQTDQQTNELLAAPASDQANQQGAAAADQAEAAPVAAAEPELIEVWRRGRFDRAARSHRAGPRRPTRHDRHGTGDARPGATAAGMPESDQVAAQSAEPPPDRRPHRKRPERSHRAAERPDRSEPRQDRGERGGRPPRPQRFGGPRREESGGKAFNQSAPPPRREREPDPNSPFAKLAALKAQLEADAKERR